MSALWPNGKDFKFTGSTGSFLTSLFKFLIFSSRKNTIWTVTLSLTQVCRKTVEKQTKPRQKILKTRFFHFNCRWKSLHLSDLFQRIPTTLLFQETQRNLPQIDRKSFECSDELTAIFNWSWIPFNFTIIAHEFQNKNTLKG